MENIQFLTTVLLISVLFLLWCKQKSKCDNFTTQSAALGHLTILTSPTGYGGSLSQDMPYTLNNNDLPSRLMYEDNESLHDLNTRQTSTFKALNNTSDNINLLWKADSTINDKESFESQIDSVDDETLNMALNKQSKPNSIPSLGGALFSLVDYGDNQSNKFLSY
jgi:hypothetical protein